MFPRHNKNFLIGRKSIQGRIRAYDLKERRLFQEARVVHLLTHQMHQLCSEKKKQAHFTLTMIMCQKKASTLLVGHLH